MSPELKAYRYYKKNFSDLYDTFLKDAEWCSYEALRRMVEHVANIFSADPDKFQQINLIAYERDVDRAFRKYCTTSRIIKK